MPFAPETDAQRQTREVVESFANEWPPQPPAVRTPQHGIWGVRNLGNTCYLSPLIPLFRETPPLLAHLCASQSPIARELVMLVVGSHVTAADPSLLLTLLEPLTKWAVGEMQDASEALRICLDALGPPKCCPFSWVFERTAVCLSCSVQGISSFDYVTLLPLAVHDAPGAVPVSALLNQAADRRHQEEVKCSDTQCSGTKALVRRAATLPFPGVVLLEVQRYKAAPEGIVRLSTPILLESELRLHDMPYMLTCVVVHGGHTPSHGHYRAFFCRDSIWYEQNDEIVSEVDREAVSNEGANVYLLSYAKTPL